jgi:DNA-binding CsgD family transcriptional regulator
MSISRAFRLVLSRLYFVCIVAVVEQIIIDEESKMELFIGRQDEQTQLIKQIEELGKKSGSIILVAGEAGVGKTCLVQTTLDKTNARILRGRTTEVSTPPFGPITQILRVYLELNPDTFSECGTLMPHLALLLPELSKQPESGDQQALIAALLCAFRSLANHEPTILLVDDLQWADNATLEFLPLLAEATQNIPLLILGVYRSDEIPRGHPLRRMRHELRRLGLLHETTLGPFGQDELTGMAAHILGARPSTQLTTILLDRTEGIPLFVEELLAALRTSGRLVLSSGEIRLDTDSDLPIPESIRDAVTLRLDGLSEQAQSLLEAAAVAGVHFDVEMVTAIAGTEYELEALVERHLINEISSAEGAFHHALVREAIYKNMTWTRRRRLHREIAAYLETNKADSASIAEHWLAGHEWERARHALIVTARKSCNVHAYRDAAAAAYRALELWPEGQEEKLRLDVLYQLGNCAQVCGMLSDAERAWREVADGRHKASDTLAYAETQRRLATVYGLQGAWGQLVTAHRRSADAFKACNLPGEAATERLAAASHLQEAGQYTEAMGLIPAILDEAEQAARHDLLALALGLKGAVHAKIGNTEAGLAEAREGLSLALDYDLTGPISEVYQRLATVLEQAGDHQGAKKAYQSAATFCEQRGLSAMEQVCIACLVVVLYQTGEWEEGVSLSQSVIDSAKAPPVAKLIASAELGLMLACKGQIREARRILQDSLTGARANEIFGLEIVCTWGLAIVSDSEDDADKAIGYCHTLLERWEQTEERHYIVPPLRWAATLFGGMGDSKAIAACASGLSRVAITTGNQEALAGLAHALGEAALSHDDPQHAVDHFRQSLELLITLEAPFDRAQTQMQYGIALVRAGQREQGIHNLIDAHRAARKLGARPLAGRISAALAEMGEQVHERLGQRATGELKRGGLTRRQYEILKLIAEGLTNAAIGERLTLSIRTIDMHVSHLLTRLDCRTRAEAVRRAAELHLL